MSKKLLTIIIIHWNTPETLRRQLSTLSNKNDSQIIVIDNASNKSVKWIKRDFPQVVLIQNKINRGFSFACNQGMNLARGGWLLFLNPDVEINPDQINQLTNYAVTNNLDAISPKPQSSNYRNPIPTVLALLSEFTSLSKILSKTSFNPKTLTGGCLLIKTETLLNLGGWDARFFLWFEDSDLTKRLIENKYKIGWVAIDVKHKGGSSFEMIDEQTKRDIFFHSMDVYARKHFNLFERFIIALIKRKYTRRKLLPGLFNGVTITIPNLKIELLDRFLKINREQISTSGVEWIVVTSSIESNDIWLWRKKYPHIRFIQVNNKGFASTVNIGFRVSTGNWVGTVNDDVTLDKNWLVNLVPNDVRMIGSINPVIQKPSGVVETAGISIMIYGKAIPNNDHYLTDHKLNGKEKYSEVDATNAAAVLYSKDALNKVGLYDEKFGSYLEDIDLSLRLKKTGYKNIVSLHSKVQHIGQSTSKNLGWKKQYYDFKNWILIIIKNWSLRDFILNSPAICIERLRNLSGILKSF